MKIFIFILSIVFISYGIMRTEIIKIVKFDTVVTIKIDTVKSIKYDTLKVTKSFKDTSILIKQDTAVITGKPAIIKK